MSEEKLEEISSDAGGSGERGEDPSIKGKKGVKGDLNKLKSSSTSQLSGAGKLYTLSLLSFPPDCTKRTLSD